MEDGDFAALLDGLNDEQREAVTSTEGYIRVIAGAGSGKTRALSYRFAYLVREVGILPGNILCATFTNKAANEMKKRIRALTGDNDTGYINTFHSFCVSVLQEDINVVGYPKNFLVIDNPDIDSMLRVIYEERGLSLRDMTFSHARDMFEMRKLFSEPEYYKDMIALPLDALKSKYDSATQVNDILFYGYLYQEKKCFALDYNDLLRFVLYIFTISEQTKLKWQQRLEYIMVDEYQDIDQIQYELMRVLCAYHRNLFIVGDPDQTIYTWRGASVKFIIDFADEFAPAKTIMMMRNYRSTPQIIGAANSLIDKNTKRVKKDLIPTLPDGAPVTYHHFVRSADEAAFIAHEVKELVSKGASPSDIAVIYRAHYVSRSLEDVFIKEKIPYRLWGSVRFYDRAEVKDALSYLRLIASGDDLSFRRVVNTPKRNIGLRRIKYLEDHAAKNSCTLLHALEMTYEDDRFKNTGVKKFLALLSKYTPICRQMPVSELLAHVLDESGYEKLLRTEGGQNRLDDLAELKQAIMDFEVNCGEESALDDFLANVSMFGGQDEDVGKSSAVKLMTVHTAKGLEFPYVFLCEMDEGIFPSKKTADSDAMEEERRLAFVAMTRARKGLYITDAEGKNADGSYRYPSRFIFNIDRDRIVWDSELDGRLLDEARTFISAGEKAMAAAAGGLPFKEGDRVRHPIMGAGTVIEADQRAMTYKIKFDAIGTERTIKAGIRLEPAQ